MTAALAGEAEAASTASASSGAAKAKGGQAGSVSSAPGNPLNAPGSARRRKANRQKRSSASRNLNDLQTQEEREAELQRRAQEAAAGQPDDSPPPASPGGGGPSWAKDQTGSPTWWKAPNPVAVGNTGGGFVLGLMGWALALAYLRGGPAEVRRLLAAKFLNRT